MNWYKIAQFSYNTDEDRVTISSPYGSVVITETSPRYEFTEDMSPEEFEKIGIDEDDWIAKIEHIEVNTANMGQGYGTALIEEAMKELSKRNVNYIYLNASPMGFDGLPLEALTNFYEKFGFKVIKEQGNNNLMGINRQ
jgi:ribosomal protein S18 acetylase RimI-like enzyme